MELSQLLNKLENASPEEKQQIEKAYKLAEEAHQGQKEIQVKILSFTR